ncbi:hypothetical protein QMQ05_01345 [Glutamicibacter ectropisis]|uniref:Uncharacterized protein n=1 Tax=Glutamicibacter ectropisis TaxID=3046593 RepID=A0AAU6WEY3_9MICC
MHPANWWWFVVNLKKSENLPHAYNFATLPSNAPAVNDNRRFPMVGIGRAKLRQLEPSFALTASAFVELIGCAQNRKVTLRALRFLGTTHGASECILGDAAILLLGNGSYRVLQIGDECR